MKKVIFLSLFISLNSMAALYGADTRQLVRASSLNSYQAAKSVGIMVATSMIKESADKKGFIDIETDTLANNQYMCSSERFSDQQSLFVSCTGFLIAPDLLVTAGHCAVTYGETKAQATPYCTDFSWFFDFEVDAFGKVKNKDIPADNIYACEQIIHAVHNSIPVSETNIIFKDDFAIIKLKKAVQNRTPLRLTSKRPSAGERATMVGHPLGGPKMTSTGFVLANEPTYVRAAVQGFEGNSGSPVFNVKGEVFGILVRGYPDSLIDTPKQKDCRIVNRCSADAKSCTQADTSGQVPGDHIMPIGLIEELKTMGLVN